MTALHSTMAFPLVLVLVICSVEGGFATQRTALLPLPRQAAHTGRTPTPIFPNRATHRWRVFTGCMNDLLEYASNEQWLSSHILPQSAGPTTLPEATHKSSVLRAGKSPRTTAVGNARTVSLRLPNAHDQAPARRAGSALKLTATSSPCRMVTVVLPADAKVDAGPSWHAESPYTSPRPARATGRRLPRRTTRVVAVPVGPWRVGDGRPKDARPIM